MPKTPTTAGATLADRAALVAGDGGEDAQPLAAAIADALEAAGAHALPARWAGGDRWQPGPSEPALDPDALVGLASGRLGGLDIQ